jgi:hypothetical protein
MESSMFNDGRALALAVVAASALAAGVRGSRAVAAGEELAVTVRVPYGEWGQDELDILVLVLDWSTTYPKWRYVNPKDYELGLDRQISAQLLEEKNLRVFEGRA